MREPVDSAREESRTPHPISSSVQSCTKPISPLSSKDFPPFNPRQRGTQCLSLFSQSYYDVTVHLYSSPGKFGTQALTRGSSEACLVWIPGNRVEGDSSGMSEDSGSKAVRMGGRHLLMLFASTWWSCGVVARFKGYQLLRRSHSLHISFKPPIDGASP